MGYVNTTPCKENRIHVEFLYLLYVNTEMCTYFLKRRLKSVL